MVFIAELFWWFEVVKPDFVQPRDLQEVRDGTTNPQFLTMDPISFPNSFCRFVFLVSSENAAAAQRLAIARVCLQHPQA